MKFDHRKLPKTSIQSLRRIEVGTFAPLETLVSPVYVYLQQNQKFVAVKAPLHYFLPEELEKLKSYKNFYLPEFVDQVVPYQKAGESLHHLLNLLQKNPVQTKTGIETAKLPLPQHELDHAILELIGGLWNPGAKVEPFFLHFFVKEFCLSLPEDLVTRFHDEDIERFELALLRSSCVVFLALHLGYCQREHLSQLRKNAFEKSFRDEKPSPSFRESSQLLGLVWNLLPNTDIREISLAILLQHLDTSSFYHKTLKKLECRLIKVQNELIHSDHPPASLYGPRGFRHG